MAPISTVTLADYLFIRLRQLGVQSVYGVPGDYNLSLLDHVEPAGLRWIGNCNELTAGYAADGYARVKGLGVLITTFGVGELSAINAIAGAYAEKAPVVHIVGTPSRASQKSRALLHHTLNDGEYRTFARMYSFVTSAQVNLTDPRTCTADVDFALQQCILQSRPVYIEVPEDMVSARLDPANLGAELVIPSGIPGSNAEKALSAVLERIYRCKQPMILVDGETRAFGAIQELSRIIELTNWPTWTTPFGKGLVDETRQNCHGIYMGNLSGQLVKDYVGSCDLVLSFGPHHSDTNSFQYSSITNPAITISFTVTEVQVGSNVFLDLPARSFLHQLIERTDKSQLATVSYDCPVQCDSISDRSIGSDIVTQNKFWKSMSAFLKPGDIVLAETGTSAHGSRELRLPRNTRYFSAVTWLSIGYMLPAALGAAMAEHERRKSMDDRPMIEPRTVLFIGEGSLQVTVQALSDVIREKLNMIIFVINNDGYTIERCIHGRKQAYNDVASWQYLLAPAFFGAAHDETYLAHTYKIASWGQFGIVIRDPLLNHGKGLHLVEILMGKEDAPASLLVLLDEQKKLEKVVS